MYIQNKETNKQTQWLRVSVALSSPHPTVKNRSERLRQPPRRRRNTGREALESSVMQSPQTPHDPRDKQSPPTTELREITGCHEDGVCEPSATATSYITSLTRQSFSGTTEPHSAHMQLLIHQRAGWCPEGPFCLGTSLTSGRCRADAVIQFLPAGVLWAKPNIWQSLQKLGQSEKLVGFPFHRWQAWNRWLMGDSEGRGDVSQTELATLTVRN